VRLHIGCLSASGASRSKFKSALGLRRSANDRLATVSTERAFALRSRHGSGAMPSRAFLYISCCLQAANIAAWRSRRFFHAILE
jgi:hypothetical protein